jgi:hypothetical protein
MCSYISPQQLPLQPKLQDFRQTLHFSSLWNNKFQVLQWRQFTQQLSKVFQDTYIEIVSDVGSTQRVRDRCGKFGESHSISPQLVKWAQPISSNFEALTILLTQNIFASATDNLVVHEHRRIQIKNSYALSEWLPPKSPG